MNRRYRSLVLVLPTCCGGFAAAQSCSFRATNIDFGNYAGTAIRMTGTLTVSCPLGTIYSIGLDAGTGSFATVLNRSMSAVGDSLHYGLYSNASYTANWGNTPGTGWVVGIGSGNDQVLTVYGLVPGRQFPTPGRGRIYNDNIVATLSSRSVRSQTARLRVSANVVDACTVFAGNMAFGAYSGRTVNSISGILVSCTNRTDYDVGLNAGTASASTVASRSMTGPNGSLLRYKLTRDPAHILNWGNTVGTDTVAETGTGGLQFITVYGQVPASQSVGGGNYSDTITVTVTF